MLVDDSNIEEAKYDHKHLIEHYHKRQEDEETTVCTRHSDKLGGVWNCRIQIMELITVIDIVLETTVEIIDLANCHGRRQKDEEDEELACRCRKGCEKNMTTCTIYRAFSFTSQCHNKVVAMTINVN